MISVNFLGKEISGVFTIPSGIVTTNAKIIERIAKDIPEIGVITTKSIGLSKRDGNKEPILSQYAPGCFVNAVGLTNPGAEEFAKQLKEVKIPKDKFLLTSIFGKDVDEFVAVAKILAPYSDGLELNLSCPHAQGYGMAIGQDPKLVKEITHTVKNVVKIPVIPKLTPNVSNIVEIAKSAVEGGADAICAINTVGPGYAEHDGNPILTNKVGGLSGKGILPVGLKCVRDIAGAVNVPVIACGGISCANDVRAYKAVGGKIFGVGSALAGMSTKEMKAYFFTLNNDLQNNNNNAEKLLKAVDMSFKKFRLVENRKLADDLSLLVFDSSYNIKPGQFVFVWIPGVGEKPFSVLDNNPLTFAIQKVGCFTEKITTLNAGEIVYVRGPYGVPIKQKKNKKIILVAGGCGFVALYQFAKEFDNVEVFFGSKDSKHLFYLDEARRYAKTKVSTDDGSAEHHGFVTELLEKRFKELDNNDCKNIILYCCGPVKMIDAVNEIAKKYLAAKSIYNSIDYMTKCGVGICGACATKSGKRLCVDGPFIKE